MHKQHTLYYSMPFVTYSRQWLLFSTLLMLNGTMYTVNVTTRKTEL